MSKPPETDREAVERVIAGGMGPSGRSPIYLWLRQNHARLAPQFEGARVSWSGVAATMAELGILDAGGRPPKAEAVRRAWWRVRRDVGKSRDARRTVRADAVPSPAPVAVPSPVVAPAPVPAALPSVYAPPQAYPPGIEPVGEDEPPRSTIRTSAGLKKWTKPTPTETKE